MVSECVNYFWTCVEKPKRIMMWYRKFRWLLYLSCGSSGQILQFLVSSGEQVTLQSFELAHRQSYCNQSFLPFQATSIMVIITMRKVMMTFWHIIACRLSIMLLATRIFYHNPTRSQKAHLVLWVCSEFALSCPELHMYHVAAIWSKYCDTDFGLSENLGSKKAHHHYKSSFLG